MSESPVANNKKTTKAVKRQGFQKGKSGNPSGRPKMTDAERDALAEIKTLASCVPDKMRAMLNSAKTPPAVKVKICEIILDRTYGKPDSTVKVETPKAAMLEDIRDEMARIRASMEDTGQVDDDDAEHRRIGFGD